MLQVDLDPAIIKAYSKQPLSAIFTIPRVIDDPTHPLHKLTYRALKGIGQNQFDLAFEDLDFQFLNRESDDLELKAKEWVLIKSLTYKIEVLRAEKLRKQEKIKIPDPYSHPALKGLPINDDYLVPIEKFTLRKVDNALIRNEHAFTISPSIRHLNSSYWLMNTLISSNLKNVHIRLDPLIHEVSDDVIFPAYKMWVYGRPLQWDEILKSMEEVHGRWMPEISNRHSAMTEFVWEPRDEEIHFKCEEVPQKDQLDRRGARYFHTIYSKKKNCFTHLDGAIRYLNESEWSDRMESHIRKSGKIGQRVKLFLVDEDISLETMSNLCANFFVWNDDVINYFN